MAIKSHHPDSKDALCREFNISVPTFRRWINKLTAKCEELAIRYSEPDYLSFKEYTTNQRILTAKQARIFRKHHT